MDVNTRPLVYQRILLKCSGEALMGSSQFGLDPTVLDYLAREIAGIVNRGVEVGLVLGGGNLFRGKALSEAGLNHVAGDQMGMLATIMNAIALRDAMDRLNLPAHIMSAIPISGVVEPFRYRQAKTYLSQKNVVIFAAGTGNPFFTTDSAACLRAAEIDADIILKATKVDGIYSADPLKHPDAVRYSRLTYQQVLQQGLAVMDATAICLAQESGIPLQIFDMAAPNALQRIVTGEQVGTYVG